jgi:hypothetical protein
VSSLTYEGKDQNAKGPAPLEAKGGLAASDKHNGLWIVDGVDKDGHKKDPGVIAKFPAGSLRRDGALLQR